MNWIRGLATKRPVVFGFLVTLVFVLMVFASSILASMWPGGHFGQWIGGTIGRALWIGVLLLVLRSLGWLHSAGVTQAGSRQAWLLILAPLAYEIVVFAYAMTGDLDFSIPDPVLTAIVSAFLLTHAVFEELAFRGLVMHALLRARGASRRGIVLSAVVSALLFAGMHLVYVLGGDSLAVGLLRGVVAISLGIVFGALVVRGKSIWPAAVFHGVLNAAGYVNLANSGSSPGAGDWLLLSVLTVPLAVFGLYLLRGAAQDLMQANAIRSPLPSRL